MTASSDPSNAYLPRLHLVTDDEVLRGADFIETAGELLREGGPRVALHLRGHRVTGRELWLVAERCATLAADSGSSLFVNDRVDVAIACGARGVQLGRWSMRAPDARRILGPGPLIGASVHDGDEAASAVAEGADFLVAGTLFGSPSHPGGAARGAPWLAQLVSFGRPVIGIGGVDAERVDEVLATGAHGVATISAVWRAPEPTRALENFLTRLE